MNSEKIYQIALTLVPKVGDVAAKKLIAYCGGAEAVFKESKKSLLLIPGIGHGVNGSMRWFKLAGFHVQISEYAKLSVIFY